MIQYIGNDQWQCTECGFTSRYASPIMHITITHGSNPPIVEVTA